mgnify:CR=1 FL=1|tara:strand:- start:16313 stop:17917 length:1605 start_codon:yes stop_codon:yes gene_type:complete
MFIVLIIFISIFIAHFPVLLGDFLKQDDWNATFWNMNDLWSHPEFHNSAVEMFRPFATLTLFLADYISLNIENAKYVRFLSIVLISISAYVTYIWQVKFSPEKKFLALSFSILAFCLPPFQLVTSTAGYWGFILSLLCGQFGLIYFYKVVMEDKNFILKNKYIIYSFILILLGCLNYALTMMFYFIFLLIFYLHNIENKNFSEKEKYLFLAKATIFIFAIMLFYIFLAKTYHYIFDIVPVNVERSVHIDFNIINKFLHILAMIKFSANIYDLSPILKVDIKYFLIFILIVYSLGLSTVISKKKKDFSSKILEYLLIVFSSLILLIFTYAPALPVKPSFPIDISFRYLIATMPFLLFIVLWSIYNILNFELISKNLKNVRNIFFIFFIILGVKQTNYIIEKEVSGPHIKEIKYIKSYVDEKLIKEIKNGEKPTLIIIRNPIVDSIFNENKYVLSRDYFLRTTFSHGWLVSAGIYILRSNAIKTIPTHKVLQWDNDAIIIKSYWGYIISVNKINTLDRKYINNSIIIDTRELSVKE